MRFQPTAVFGAAFESQAPIPELLGSETTFRERPDIGCLLVNCAVDTAVVVSVLSASVGLDFPLSAGAILNAPPHVVIWLTPRSWLLHCPVDQEWALATRINDTFSDKRVHAALFTDCLCWFELSGPQALDHLANGGFISLERDGLGVGDVKRTSIAGIAAVVIRVQSPTWLLGIDRSRAVYFKEWLRAGAQRSARDLQSQFRRPII